MGASKKRDRRAAAYQERQRQDAANAKAEKERQKREDYWSQAVVPNQKYAGTWVIPAGVSIIGAGTLNGWTVSTDYTQVEKVELPKSESTEVITAYRMWHLKRTFPTGYRLVPLNERFGDVEPFEKLVAVCLANGNHEAPDDFCTCGFHGYKASVPLDHHGKPYVAGEVSLWGKVVEHSDGYRAQFAYPRKLYVIDGGPRADKIAEALSWTYGVPCDVWDG